MQTSFQVSLRGMLWLWIGLGLCLNFTFSPSRAEIQNQLLTVIARENQSIRDIAQEYLNNPDLWREILRHNQLSATEVTRVSAGTALRIPFTQVSNANKSLIDSLGLIRSGTVQGAKVFAPDLIDKAILRRDSALQAKKAGNWEECLRLANEASESARKALLVSKEQRNAAIEALLTNRLGTVQSRKPTDLQWLKAVLNSKFIEQEKVRTLSDSLAEITFRDGSRLGLNENSQTIIQKMRVDRLSRKKEASVVLLEGDVYALLGGNGRKNDFSLKTPGVETIIESKHFWARRERKSTQFANYDSRKIEVLSRDQSSVTLGRNQGAIVPDQGKPGELVDLLPEPSLVSPEDDYVSVQANIEFEWDALPGALSYWLEIAHDPAFRSTFYSRRNIRRTAHGVDHLSVGDFFWRVTAFGAENLPGENSLVRHFSVQDDNLAPYLAIFSPAMTGVMRTPSVSVEGETELGARLKLNDEIVDLGVGGRFTTSVSLQKGVNDLRFEAVDRAGHSTRRVRSVLFIPDVAIPIHYATDLPQIGPKHFVTTSRTFVLAGRTTPDAQVVAVSESGIYRAATYADRVGLFDLNLPLESSKELLKLKVTLPTGEFSEDAIRVTVDDTPPDIALNRPPPAYIANDHLVIKGRVIGGTQMTINGRSVKLIQGLFEEQVDLRSGDNLWQLRASDLAGNVKRLTFKTILDKNPPKLVGYKLSSSATTAGKLLNIWVDATDVSGLKETAPFDLQIDSKVISGYLRLVKPKKGYRAQILLPERSATARLKSVVLHDYLNNGERYAVKN